MIAALLDAADREVRRGGLDPHLHAQAILDCWRRAERAHFARLAVLAAVRPPTAVTVAEFLETVDTTERKDR